MKRGWVGLLLFWPCFLFQAVLNYDIFHHSCIRKFSEIYFPLWCSQVVCISMVLTPTHRRNISHSMINALGVTINSLSLHTIKNFFFSPMFNCYCNKLQTKYFILKESCCTFYSSRVQSHWISSSAPGRYVWCCHEMWLISTY